MADVTQQIQATIGQPSSVRIGAVTSVNPFTVSVQGVSYRSLGVLGSYAPVVGDSVALLGQSPQSGTDPASWLVLGDTRAIPFGYQAGSESITFVTLTSFTIVVTFNRPFPSVPAMAVNINSSAGSTSNWHARAFNITTTQFTLFLFGPSSSFTDIPVQWHGHVMTQ